MSSDIEIAEIRGQPNAQSTCLVIKRSHLLASLKHKQQGALLIELAVVLSLVMLMAVYAVSTLSQRQAELRIQSLALWMGAVQHAFQQYINDYGAQLTENGYVLAGVSKSHQPTVAELKGLGYLNSDFPLTMAQRYKVKLLSFIEPNCVRSDCAIYGLVWAPAVVNSNHDFAYWKLSTAGAGAIVTAQHAAYISAINSELQNPPQLDMEPIPPGSLALLITPDTLGLNYLRVGDARNPYFKNNVNVGGDLQVDGLLYATKGIHLKETNTAASTCARPGSISRNENSNSLLICSEQYNWQSIGFLAGGTFSVSMSGECRHPILGNTVNPVTKTCACPIGFQSVLIAVSGSTLEDSYLTYACSP